MGHLHDRNRNAQEITLRSLLRFLIGNSALLLCGAALAWGQQPTVKPSPAQSAAVQGEAEGPIERLLRIGAVDLRFYEPRDNPRDNPGWSEFYYDVRHKFIYDYEQRRRGPMTHVTLHVKVSPPTFSQRHIVHLPKALEQAKPWTVELARHELDHVAISADPRVEMLLAHLQRHVTRLERDVDASQKVDDVFLQKTIDQEMTTRRNAVIAVVNTNYDLLDRLTQHGTDELPKRDEFFAWLYTKPCLDQAKFPYTSDVLELLKSDAYQKSAPIHLKSDEESTP